MHVPNFFVIGEVAHKLYLSNIVLPLLLITFAIGSALGGIIALLTYSGCVQKGGEDKDNRSFDQDKTKTHQKKLLFFSSSSTEQP